MFKTNPKALRRRGFTLIELLAVIAIIAVLAAILIPIIAKARERARSAACVSQMRSLGQGYLLYAQTNGGFLPGVIQNSENSLSETTIGSYAWRYAPHILWEGGFVDDLSGFYSPLQESYTYPDSTTVYGESGWAKEGYYVGYNIITISDDSSFPEDLRNVNLMTADPRLPILINFHYIEGSDRFSMIPPDRPLNTLHLDGSVSQIDQMAFSSLRSWSDRLRYIARPQGYNP